MDSTAPPTKFWREGGYITPFAWGDSVGESTTRENRHESANRVSDRERRDGSEMLGKSPWMWSIFPKAPSVFFAGL